jgi:hypothetical protein
MPPLGFEPKISAGERPQTYTLERAATWTSSFELYHQNNHTACKLDKSSLTLSLKLNQLKGILLKAQLETENATSFS